MKATPPPRHPLHDAEFKARAEHSVGAFWFLRRRGTSTAQALQALAEAIQNPGMSIELKDHAGSREATQHLAWLVRDIATRLELRHIHVDKYLKHCGPVLKVCFENREKDDPK